MAGHLRFHNPEPYPAPEDDWGFIEACFVDNTLGAMNIVGSYWSTSRTLDDWIEEYGPPDRVTWSRDYYTRSLIWAEAGMLVVIDVETESTSNVILFSPMPSGELDGSWLLDSLPSTGEPYTGDEAPLPRELEVEDPWGFNNG